MLKNQYRSDKNELIAEFFLPCLSNCISYDRCIEYVTIKSLITISFSFQNFTEQDAKIRMISGNKFGSSDLNILTKLFSKQSDSQTNKGIIKNNKINMLKYIIDEKKFELKIAIPQSENLDGSFAEKLGIFKDAYGNIVAFSGTSSETFNYQSRNFESIDVFTSWNDESRINDKLDDFDELWNNKIEYVKMYSFSDAEKNNLLKYTMDWAVDTS